MDQAEKVFDLLAKLNFSFWQVFGIVVIIVFRKQIAEMLNRLDSIESAMAKIKFGKAKSKVPEKINKVLSLKLPLLSDGNEISKELYSLKEELLIDALERIKSNTTFLWSDFSKAVRKNKNKCTSLGNL